ncbi:MAG: hypothetical protein MZW92_12305 [Comamonadaceae bacterium]|nr:hypothetical protein [Comamonadaceae bacterium]
MPFLCVIAYFLIGFVGRRSIGWLVFLAIPVTAILFGGSGRGIGNKLTALSPFIATVAFIILGEYDLESGWLVFLLIPTFGALSDRSWKGKIFALTLVLASAGFYLYCGYVLSAWGYGALCFLLPLVFGAATGFVDIVVDWKDLKRLPVSQRASSSRCGSSSSRPPRPT